MTPRIMCKGDCTSTNIAGPQEPPSYYKGAPQIMMNGVYRSLLVVYPDLYDIYGPMLPCRGYTKLVRTEGEGMEWDDDRVRIVIAFPHFNIYILHVHRDSWGEYKFHCCAISRFRSPRRGLYILMDGFDIEGLGSLLSVIQVMVDHCNARYVQCLSCCYANDTAAHCGMGMTMDTGTCNQWEENYD